MKILKIGINPSNFGYCAFFEHKGEEFYADLCSIPLLGTECMVFPSIHKQVVSWTELYCLRDIPVSEESLKACIDEFIQQYEKDNVQ